MTPASADGFAGTPATDTAATGALGTVGAGPAPGGRARAVFFGSGPFALPVLEAVRQAPELALVAVVSTPDRPAGRRSALTATPVASEARQAGLPLLQPPSLRDPEAVAALRSLAPVVGILADYGRIVPPELIEVFPRGILNLHPSLLPRHRGATPIQAAILAGDPMLGISLIELVDEVDAGPIIARFSWAASGIETAPALEARASNEAARLLAENLRAWLDGTIASTAQDHRAATFTSPLRREDGRLEPHRSAVSLERMVRAYVGWPGTHLNVDDLRIAVLAASSERAESIDPAEPGDPAEPKDPGRIIAIGDGLGLRTPDGILGLVTVQPAGGRPMSGAELRRGRPSLVGREVGT